MVTEKKRMKLLVGLIVLVLTAIVVLLIVYAAGGRGKAAAPSAVTPRPAQEVVVREKEVEKIVTVEKEISSAILTDGVRELGLLVTDEYYFTAAVIEKDGERKRITVSLPPAAITDVDIDPESFQLYSEKAGLGNPISAEDFNNALVELEATARDKALARGLLDRADENAHALVRRVVGALVDLNEYTLVFVRAKG